MAAVADVIGVVEVLVIQFGDLRCFIRRIGRLGLMVVLCVVIVCPIGRCAASAKIIAVASNNTKIFFM